MKLGLDRNQLYLMMADNGVAGSDAAEVATAWSIWATVVAAGVDCDRQSELDLFDRQKQCQRIRTGC